MKTMIAVDLFMAYPNLHIRWCFQLPYRQGNHLTKPPVACWTCILTKSQQNNHTTEKELLFIVVVLEEFHSMLLGVELFIHSDHKNLTFANLDYHCILHCHLFVRDYGPTILNNPRKKNVNTSQLRA